MSGFLHFVLVHGTFSSPNVWTQFHSYLSACPNTAGVTLFRWSGLNLQSERLKAAQELAENIADIRLASSDTKICVISHSHGGNVCWHALDLLKDPTLIDSVVTLGTPFLVAHTRILNWIPLTLTVLGAVLLLVMYFVAILFVLPPTYFAVNDFERICLNFALPVLSVGFLVWFAWFLTHSEDLCKDAINRYKADNAERVAPSYSRHIPNMVCLVRRDEAYWYLRAINRISAIVSDLANIHNNALERAWNQMHSSYVFVTIGMLFVPHLWLGMLLLATVAVPVYVIGGLFQALLRSHRWAYGDIGLLPMFLFNVRVEKTPPKTIPVAVVWVDHPTTGLRHSTFFSSQSLFELIVNWGCQPEAQLRSRGTQSPTFKLAERGLSVAYVILAFLLPFVAPLWIFRNFFS